MGASLKKNLEVKAKEPEASLEKKMTVLKKNRKHLCYKLNLRRQHHFKIFIYYRFGRNLKSVEEHARRHQSLIPAREYEQICNLAKLSKTKGSTVLLPSLTTEIAAEEQEEEKTNVQEQE